MSTKLGSLTKDSEILNMVSGEFQIKNNDLKILSGNFIQTNNENVKNYSARNSFLQAEEATSYGPAYTGSRGYCILAVIGGENTKQLKLSGDLSAIQPSDNYFYSIALETKFVSYCSKVIKKDGQFVTLDNLPDEILVLSSKTEQEFINWFISDDNAFYSPGHPEIGNCVIQNFYGNHAEGGSTRGIGKYAHAEGRDTTADGRYSHAEGSHCVAGGLASHAEGFMTKAIGYSSHTSGKGSVAKDNFSFVWAAEGGKEKDPYSSGDGEGNCYLSKGPGTFCIKPRNNENGFFIGDKSLLSIITENTNSKISGLLKGKNYDLETGIGTLSALQDVISALGGFYKPVL